MSPMEIIALLLMLVGLVGIVYPVLPGLIVIVVGVLVWALDARSSAGWILLTVVIAIYLAGVVLQWAVPGKRMKRAGVRTSTLLVGLAGAIVGIHDIGKGVLAVLLAELLFPDLACIGAVAGVACVLGHIFPVFMKFRGGKGFASYLGMTLALNWKFALIILAIVVVVTLITDYIVVGTVTTVVSVPVAMGFLRHSVLLVAILCVATAVILYKHRENYVRIRKGTEIGLSSAFKGGKRTDKG